MNLLLDTHIWIWSFNNPDRLTDQVRTTLLDQANELWLSPISIWELLLLIDKGRIAGVGRDDPRHWAERAFARRPLRDAALTKEVALRSGVVSVRHLDPADRFLAATASVYDLTLVTADVHLLVGSGYDTLANR